MKPVVLILFLVLFCLESFADLCQMKKDTGLFDMVYVNGEKVLYYVERVEGTQNLVILSIVHEFKLTQDGKLPTGITSEMVVNNYDKSLKRLVAYEESKHLMIFLDQELNIKKQRIESGFSMRRGPAASQAGEYYLVILREENNKCLKTLLNPLYPRSNDNNNRYIDITSFNFTEIE